MANLFEQLAAPLESLRVTRERTFDRLRTLVSADKKILDWTRPIAGAELTLAEMETRLVSIGDLVAPLLDGVDSDLTPLTFVTQLRASLEQLTSQIESANAQLDGIASNGGISTIPEDQGVLTSANGQASWNFAKWTRATLGAIDNVLSHFFLIRSSRNDTLAVSFDSTIAEQRRLLEVHRAQFGDLIKRLSDASAELEAIAKLRKTLEETASEAEASRSETEKSRKNVAEYEAEATQKLATLRELSMQADKLAATVQGFQTQFDQFQQKLEERDQNFVEGKEKLDELNASIAEKKKEIERINRQAEDMLKGATVAGLASTFGALRDRLTSEVNWARGGFYLSICVLGLSVLPLAVYVVPGFTLGGLFALTPTVNEFEIGQVIVRALLLIPAAWLTKFAAARHASLFRLREHYAYKYSIATSVEGFKKQAPSFEEGIAAAAFHELTFNPADRMEISGQDVSHPNPIMEWFLKKIGATHDGKSK